MASHDSVESMVTDALKSALNSFTILRIVSFGLAFALHDYLAIELYYCIFLGVLFCHYTLAMTYVSPQHYRELVRTGAGRFATVSALVVLGIMVASCFSSLRNREIPLLVAYFGLHHVLTDVYSVNRILGRGTARNLSALSFSRLLFNLVGYATLFSSLQPFVSVPLWIWGVLLFSTFGGFLFMIFKEESYLESSSKWDVLAFETAYFVIVLAVKDRIRFEDIILYHLIFWFFMPARAFWNTSPKSAAKFAFQSFALSGFFFAFSPIIPLIGQSADAWMITANVFGFFHVTSAFVVSKFNPAFFVRRVFGVV
jgi:hypothetical protein